MTPSEQTELLRGRAIVYLIVAATFGALWLVAGDVSSLRLAVAAAGTALFPLIAAGRRRASVADGVAVATDLGASLATWYFLPEFPLLSVIPLIWVIVYAWMRPLGTARIVGWLAVGFALLESVGDLFVGHRSLGIAREWDAALGALRVGLAAAVAIMVAQFAERRAAQERERLDANARVASVLEHDPNGILVVQEGRVVLANPRARDLLGMDPEGAGVATLPFDVEGWWHASRETVVARLDEERVLEVNAVEVSWSGGPAGLVVLTDVTERVHALEALRATEAFVRRSFDESPVPSFIADRSGRVSAVNQALEHLLGYRPVGLLWVDLVVDGANCEAASRPPRNLALRRSDGGEVWVEVDSSPWELRTDDGGGFVARLHDITPLRAMRSRLSATEHRYRDLFEGLPVALYRTDPQGRVLAANQALADLLGYPDVASLQGLDASTAYVVAGERDRVAAEMERHGVIVDHETPLRRRDGSVVWVRDTARVVEIDGAKVYEGALVDVTGRRMAEDELRRRVAQQEAVAALGQLALEANDVERVREAAVATLVEVLGADAADILDRAPDGTFVVRAGQGPAAGQRRVVAQDGDGSLAAYTARAGVPILVDDIGDDERFVAPTALHAAGMRAAVTAPLRSGTRLHGIVAVFAAEPGVFDDFDAAFVVAVGNVVTAAQHRAAARARLEELVRSKDEFVASVSHELRTPLTVVGGLAQELHAGWRDMDRDEVEELLSLMVHQSQDMSHLIEDLLVAARADIGKVSVLREDVDIAAEVGTVVAGLFSEEPVECGFRGPAVAAADSGRVRQILRNLISNAFRYGEPPVRVEAEVRGDVVVVSVIDAGMGVPDAHVERVFDPYHRAHEQVGRPGSVGLELTVSRQLARLMGGDLRHVKDERGSVFELSLPGAESAAGRRPESYQPDHAAG